MRRFLTCVLLVVLMTVPTWALAADAPAPAAAPPAAAPPPVAPAAAPPPAPSAPTPAAAAATAALRADLDRIMADAGLPKKMTTAVRIVALAEPATREAAEVLYSVRADLPLIPASTMKLVTTAACLDRLGPDWRLRTYVGRLPVEGRKDDGDLGVIGGGDTNFSGRFYGGDAVGALRQWAKVLKDRGVKSLGRIVLDDSLFDQDFVHPTWPADQRAEWYEAPVGALSLNDNCLDVHVAAGAAVGQPARVWLDPAGDFAAVDGAITTVADRAKHTFSLQRVVDPKAEPPLRIKAGGRFWVKAPEAVENRTVADPTMFFGLALAATLRAEGIAVAGPVIRGRLVDKDGAAVPEFTADLVHASRLDATIAVADKQSQGLYAECLMKILGAWGPTPDGKNPLPPRQGTWENGTAEARRWMVERGVPADGCVMVDGSGLSKDNRLTALAVTELLAVMYARHGDLFLQSLAVAGQDGSLSKRMRNTPAEGRVFGKTGYVLGASALSGYVRAKSGRLVAYSILMNDVPWGELWKARTVQDKVCVRLVEF